MNLLLNRRVTCAAAAVGIACVFYGAYAFLILERVDSFMSRFGPIDPSAPLDEEVDKFLTLLELSLVGIFLPSIWWVLATQAALRRWYREQHDLCAICAKPITSWHGRCPGCGTRIGADRPHVHTLVLRGR